MFQCLPAAATVITSSIPHGLINNDVVQIEGVSTGALNAIIGQWPVTVLSPVQFSIPFDSSAFASPFQVTVYQLPRISLNRINSLFLYIVTKKIELGVRLTSKSATADNALVVIAK